VVEDLLVGTGAPVVSGDTVSVTYVGSFTDGKQFEAGKHTFRVGAGAVIKGWDQGLVGMQVGGKRRLTIPPNLAYGAEGSGTIPGDTTIVFDIDLLLIAGK
jgi:FKBP-type peptidyl-prolyl cis-trans isomerase